MSKVVVKFTKGWGKYNAKDIAGFASNVAEDLVKVKKVAKLHNGGAVEKSTVKLEVGTEEVDKVIAEAEAQFQQKADELEQASSALDDRSNELDERSAGLSQREADLEKREADLEKREKAVKAAEAAQAKDPAPKDPASRTPATPAVTGKPPKQGAK